MPTACTYGTLDLGEQIDLLKARYDEVVLARCEVEHGLAMKAEFFYAMLYVVFALVAAVFFGDYV